MISVLSGPIRWQVFDIIKALNGRHRINMQGGWTLLMRWYVVCLVLVRFVRFSCIRHPVCIRWCPFALSCERSTTRQVTELPGWVTHAHYVIIQWTLYVSYSVHIRFVRYTSVTYTLDGCPLSIPCLVRMRSLRLPHRFSPPLRQLTSPDKHFLQIFCYLYPFICDITITLLPVQ